MNRTLVISPHPDDGELWAGASMARWSNVTHAVLACGDEDRRKEVRAASEVLGVELREFGVFDTKFDFHRKYVRQILCSLNKEIDPDLVIIPPTGDRHQDHQVVHEEGRRAFRFCSLLGFDIPYNEPANRPTWYQEVSYQEVMTKLAAIQCYESQQDKQYMKIEHVRGLMDVRGCEIRKDHAEAFEVIRWIN